MSRARRLVLTLVWLAAGAATAAGLPSVAGAASPTTWLCKPGMAEDPCAPPLATTRFTAAGQKLGVQRIVATKDRTIDCFYVYPTVSDQKSPLATLAVDPEQRSIALYQAARYSQHCRVYAPMYRQLTLQAIAAPVTPTDRLAAYGDVRDAWREYLRRYNKGRGFVLIGHSQGSFMLRELVKREIDRKKSVRARLVSALLLGGNVTVAKGRDAGGDFDHVPACRSPRQLGCVVAFSTYNEPVPATSRFGRTTEKGLEVLCTNPARLAGGSGIVDPVFPSAPFAPGTTIALAIGLLGVQLPTAPTTFVTVPRAYRAHCSSAGGADVLQITPRGGAPVFHHSPDANWGLHLVDANIALGNLIDLVRTQATAYGTRRT